MKLVVDTNILSSLLSERRYHKRIDFKLRIF